MVTWKVDAGPPARPPPKQESQPSSHTSRTSANNPTSSSFKKCPALHFQNCWSYRGSVSTGTLASRTPHTLESRPLSVTLISSRFSTPVQLKQLPSVRLRKFCIPVILEGTHYAVQSSCLSLNQQKVHPRIRLINVHLDSLLVRPSLRPRRLQIVSSYLRAAGYGLVAGDFNSVLPEDDTLVNGSHLIDHGRSCIQMKTALLGG